LITKMEHPPYSHDLDLNDFWQFPKIKSALKGWLNTHTHTHTHTKWQWHWKLFHNRCSKSVSNSDRIIGPSA
jgi:hypothetical protein